MDLMGNSRLGSRGDAAVVALGNPYRTDDGVGIAVLRALGGETGVPSSVTGDRSHVDHGSSAGSYHLVESAHGGMPLAQTLVGLRRALVVDAAPFLPPGQLSLFPIADGSPIPDQVGWLHGLGLAEALAALAHAGLPVPECWALAIGVPADPPFGEELSPSVARAVPRAVEEVKQWLTRQ
ncbi:MAG: hydrogenase maturation protease [Candidatus Bipolaricaulaceae bacterium]